jgi:acyl-ACP thioesterase
MDDFAPVPDRGRTYSAVRRVRLSDMDSRGRVRLDTIARFLQDVAIDDVQETGWGIPDHLWFIRSIRLHVVLPFLADREVELVTWCDGTAAIAAGRRWSVGGDAGGRAEVDSVWIHLTPDERPARINGFGLYAEAASGRTVSSKLALPDPPGDAERVSWQVRVTDIDRHGHVNNTAYWQAIEERLARRGADPAARLRVRIEYRHPIDPDDEVSLLEYPAADAFGLAFVTPDGVKSIARVEPRPGSG